MNKQYYLSNNGTHIGPFTLDTILKKIESKEHEWTDYVYDETHGEWMMLLEHPEFAAKLSAKPSKPTSKPGAEKTDASLQDKEWFILKEGNNYGPFNHVELVQMLQEKTLYEYDYVWNAKMPAWKRVAELEDFAPDKMRSLITSRQVEVSEIFFRRRHARVSYGASLIVHNSKAVFRGKALEISAGGAGVLIENPNLQPGQSLFLHFQPGDGVPPFNAVCQIVSKQFVKETGSMTSISPVRYGVKFTTLSQSIRESIRNYTTVAKAA